MTHIKHLAFALALIGFSALLVGAQAQTPRINTVNIAAQSDKVEITAQGDVLEMRVDVADESGEVVFQSGAITGQQLDWNMKDASGERVAAGAYMVTVTYRNAAGKLKKRVEQVTVEEAEQSGTQDAAEPCRKQ
jgi:flagellar hook assembly protein FlgD